MSEKSDLGGMVYPFLAALDEFELVSRELAFDARAVAEPTLRWVKDSRVLDLYCELDTASFLQFTGLRLFPERKGGFVMSKRLSRVMRPFRFWRFFEVGAVDVFYDETLDEALWDGCGLMSRDMALRLLANLDEGHPDYESHRRELEQGQRFEYTVLHADGQDKGHALVVDGLAHDFVFPAGSVKREIALRGAVFVGLVPVHHRDEMRLDVQSLINLYPFFDVEQLQRWTVQESVLFLQSIENGRVDRLMGRLGRFESRQQLDAFRRWPVADFLASGGSLMWFGGTVRGMARQHELRLRNKNRRFRLPVPGGRYYIFPAAVGGRQVAAGECLLDPATATCWVADEDWLDYIVEVLGGCDGDDALWCVPFTDHDGTRQVLIWRSPNQPGEYVLLRPAVGSHTLAWALPDDEQLTWPVLDSRDLPLRIDGQSATCGVLEPVAMPTATAGYDVASMRTVIEAARLNAGVLGRYVNTLMVIRALYGRMPKALPAKLEDVIDGSVKDVRDMAPVLAWIERVSNVMRRQSRERPVPAALLDRLGGDVAITTRVDHEHWLSRLATFVDVHLAAYRQASDALAQRAHGDVQIEIIGRWGGMVSHGRALRAAYGRELARAMAGGGADWTAVAGATLRKLAEWPAAVRQDVVMGAAASIYAERGNDALLWQAGVAELFLEGLRGLGAIGQPVWVDGVALRYERVDALPERVVVRLNGVWFNWLRLRREFDRMGSVPRELARETKRQLQQMSFAGKRLSVRSADDRLALLTEHGNLFGMVAKGQEGLLQAAGSWTVVEAAATNDGNVNAVLCAA